MYMEEEAEAFKRRQINAAYETKPEKHAQSSDEKSKFIKLSPEVLEECKQEA